MLHDGTDVTLLTCGEVTYVIVRPKALTVKISPYLALKHGEFISSLQPAKSYSTYIARLKNASGLFPRSMADPTQGTA